MVTARQGPTSSDIIIHIEISHSAHKTRVQNEGAPSRDTRPMHEMEMTSLTYRVHRTLQLYS